jgi:hypothetical protein
MRWRENVSPTLTQRLQLSIKHSRHLLCSSTKRLNTPPNNLTRYTVASVPLLIYARKHFAFYTLDSNHRLCLTSRTHNMSNEQDTLCVYLRHRPMPRRPRPPLCQSPHQLDELNGKSAESSCTVRIAPTCAGGFAL